MDAQNIYIYESGKQNPQSILFLHASGASSKMWKRYIPAFENRFHCIAIDLPGHGNSRETRWTNIDQVTDVIAEIIKTKSHGKPHIIGISLGGSLILKLLEKHATLISKVIVDGASAVPIKGTWAIVTAVYLGSFFLKTKMIAKIMKKMMMQSGVSEEDSCLFVEDMQNTDAKSFRKAMIQACLLKLDLEKIHFENPTCWVSGGKESETMHHSHSVLAQKNTHSYCLCYPNKAHAWIFTDFTTHIQLVKFFLEGDLFPEKLQMKTQ